MANIVLRSKLANSNIIVENKIITTPVKKETVQMNIIAKQGYSVKAEDFTHGLLPQTIRSINFNNSDNGVIATVHLKKEMLDNKYRIIYLPISAQTRPTRLHLSLKENLVADATLLTNFETSLSTSTIDNKNTYNTDIHFNTKTLLFKRTFYLTEKERFTIMPSYEITGDTSKYTVEEKIIYKGQDVAGKSFTVYYYAPSDSLESEVNEEITFTVRTTVLAEEPGNKVATKKEEYKIYSFDKGRNVGPQGGVRKIKVNGVPGTPFKLLLQDSDKKTYNPKTGTYEAGGGIIEGVIPAAKPELGYGQYIASIKVPRSTTAVSYSDRLISDLPVDHKAIKSTTDANVQLSGQSVIEETVVAPETRITITFDTTGGFITRFKPVILGPGLNGQQADVEADNYHGREYYKFQIKPSNPDHTFTLHRQPNDPQGGPFVEFDSGDKSTAATSTGAEITSDWQRSEDPETSSLSLTTTFYIDDSLGIVHGTIVIGSATFGQADNTYSLKLLNFITPS